MAAPHNFEAPGRCWEIEALCALVLGVWALGIAAGLNLLA